MYLIGVVIIFVQLSAVELTSGLTSCLGAAPSTHNQHANTSSNSASAIPWSMSSNKVMNLCPSCFPYCLLNLFLCPTSLFVRTLQQVKRSKKISYSSLIRYSDQMVASTYIGLCICDMFINRLRYYIQAYLS